MASSNSLGSKAEVFPRTATGIESGTFSLQSHVPCYRPVTFAGAPLALGPSDLEAGRRGWRKILNAAYTEPTINQMKMVCYFNFINSHLDFFVCALNIWQSVALSTNIWRISLHSFEKKKIPWVHYYNIPFIKISLQLVYRQQLTFQVSVMRTRHLLHYCCCHNLMDTLWGLPTLETRFSLCGITHKPRFLSIALLSLIWMYLRWSQLRVTGYFFTVG